MHIKNGWMFIACLDFEGLGYFTHEALDWTIFSISPRALNYIITLICFQENKTDILNACILF